MHLKKMHKSIEWNKRLQSLHLLFSAAKACTPITNGRSRSAEVIMICYLFVNKKAVWKHLPEYWKTVWKPTQLGAWSQSNRQAPWHQHLAAFSSSGCREMDGRMQVSAHADNESSRENGAINTSYAWKRMETSVKRADLMMTESLGFSFTGISEIFKQNKLQSTLCSLHPDETVSESTQKTFSWQN